MYNAYSLRLKESLDIWLNIIYLILNFFFTIIKATVILIMIRFYMAIVVYARIKMDTHVIIRKFSFIKIRAFRLFSVR